MVNPEEQSTELPAQHEIPPDPSHQPSQWMQEAIDILISESPATDVRTVRVLSHALPCPSTNQEESSQTSQASTDLIEVAPSPATTFPFIIEAIGHKLRPSHPPLPCILVTHAVPPRFNLANLPSTPPITPNMSAGAAAEDYFTTPVYNTAVSVSLPVIEHQVHEPPDLPVQRSTPSMPSTPIPLVPPGTIHVSLLERYIPPSSVQEYRSIFSLAGGSILADRLVELGEGGGSLLFIYPTRRGAQTFTRECLGPVLDPMLRAMVVIHELSADVGTQIGKMDAVDQMYTFETMTDKIRDLCDSLSVKDDEPVPNALTRSSAYQLVIPFLAPRFEVVHAVRGHVRLDRRVWTYWWTQQESPRVREILGRYFRRARHLPRDKEVTASQLIREVVDGVTQRPYSPGRQPGNVEVGVWVIRRTR